MLISAVLQGSVLALDDSALDIDQVDNLIKFCPTKEEMEVLKVLDMCAFPFLSVGISHSLMSFFFSITIVHLCILSVYKKYFIHVCRITMEIRETWENVNR